MSLSFVNGLARTYANHSTFAWNGPVCAACGRGYLGTPHVCAVPDLKRRIAELQALVERTENGESTR